MNKKSTLMGMSLIICLTTFILFSLTGCQEEESKLWVDDYVQEFPPGTDDYVPLAAIIERNEIDIVLVRTFNANLEMDFIPLFFTDHGVQNGTEHFLVPLTEQNQSVFNKLGIIIDIDINGKEATLTRGRTFLTFVENSISMFINREDVLYLPDMPFNYRGTLYIPFEPVLNAFEIPYEVEYNVLIIRGG